MRLGARSAPGLVASSKDFASTLLDALQRGLPTCSVCEPFATTALRSRRRWKKKGIRQRPSISWHGRIDVRAPGVDAAGQVHGAEAVAAEELDGSGGAGAKVA